MTKHRWQAAITARADTQPAADVPPGWKLSTTIHGVWCPVGFRNDGVLWRRLLDEKPTRELVDAKADPNVPEWARKVRDPGASPRLVVEMVVFCVREVTGTKPNPHRSKGNASELLKLWRNLGRPPLQQFCDDVKLVALAFRECPEPLFARDVRGEGWSGGVDRSRSVATLCVIKRWDERLRAALQWQGKGPDGSDIDTDTDDDLPPPVLSA